MNRLLSLLTTITLLINTLSILAVPVSAATVSDFVYENYSVKYTVKSEKVQTKAIEITLKNTGTEAMYSWALGFDATGKISGLKGAEIYANEETSYVLKNTDKNFELAAGKSVVISYTLTGTKLATPKVFELMSYRVFAEGGFEAKLHRDDKEIETFEGGVTVTNTGETPIVAWALSFDANFEITKLASGKILNFEDKRYTISNANRQTPIAPGESFEIAFSAKNSAGVIPKIENVTLTKVEITAKEYANVPQIEAWAEYEESTLTLKWESSLPVGKFTIYESSDDKTYTKRIELKNKFEYIYKYGFEKRFFKVVQTRDSITSESIAFVVEKTTDPVTGAVTFVSARPDADGDGLENYIEDILGTDRDKADTDNDGLTDYEEVYLAGSDPLIYDSIKAGVSDANADADEDGLNTRQEINLGTNPLDEDSDYDGLDDGAEVNTHHTNPLKSDTDGDFIPDGDELALGLNPNSAATNGIPDNQRTTAQTIGKNSESLQYINSQSDTKFSLQITAAGLAENSLSSGESGYAAAMNNPAIIGVIPEFTYTEGLTVSEVTIAAEISSAHRANTVGTYAAVNPEFEGIKRLNFFRYFEEINTLLPVETTFDISKNMMYTKTDELGTYCIMDMEIWLDSLGGAEFLEAAQADTEPETEPEQQAMRAFSAESLGAAMSVNPVLPGANEAAARSMANPKKKNVIFIAENTDEFNEYFELSKDFITDKGDYAELIPFDYDNSKEIKYDVSEKVLEYLNSGGYDKNADTYIFLVFNEKTTNPDDTDETDEKDDFRASENRTAFALLSKLNSLRDNKPYISIIADFNAYESYGFLVKLTADQEKKGTIININSENIATTKFKTYAVTNEIYDYLYLSGEPLMYISSVGLTPLPPEFDRDKIYSYYREYLDRKGFHLEDTDLDGLYNFEEIDFSSGLIKPDEKVDFLPTLEECCVHRIIKGKNTYVQNGLKRFIASADKNDSILETLNSVRILPLNSDPTMVDGDSDGILDIDEFEWNEIDERYRNISPLRADTVESLYPEFSGLYNFYKKRKPIYLDIEGNHITINIRYSFNNDDSETEIENLYDFNNTELESTEKRKLTKQDLLDGVVEIWSHSYDTSDNVNNDITELGYFRGKLYDFYPGMKITVELNFIESSNDCIKINYYNENTAGNSHIAFDNSKRWFNYNSSIINVYQKWEDGEPKSVENILHSFSHEFGHAMGLADAYGSQNNGYEIYSSYKDPNLEFQYIDPNFSKHGTFDAGEIMVNNGNPCSNDIEMILQAFIDKQIQWFCFEPTIYPGYKVSISKAIKNPVIIYKKSIEVKINNKGEIETEKKLVPTYHAYKQYENKNELEEFLIYDLDEYV